jgi:hypothetical protein
MMDVASRQVKPRGADHAGRPAVAGTSAPASVDRGSVATSESPHVRPIAAPRDPGGYNAGVDVDRTAITAGPRPEEPPC